MRKFLFIVALIALAWIFVVPGCSPKFGCAAAGIALENGNNCPSDLDEAARNATWAAERLKTIKDEDLTAGLFYDEDGSEQAFDSSQDGYSDAALKIGRELGIFPRSGRPFVVDHVEVKVAAVMRDSDVRSGVLLINNPGGPCSRRPDGSVGPMSCLAVVPKMLPPGSELTVWWPPQPEGRTQMTTLHGGR